MWREARKAAFTPEVIASPLAVSPYDLRHAAGRSQPWTDNALTVLVDLDAACRTGKRRMEWL